MAGVWGVKYVADMPPMICCWFMLPALSIQLLQGRLLHVQGGLLQEGSTVVVVVVVAVPVQMGAGAWAVTTPSREVTMRWVSFWSTVAPLGASMMHSWCCKPKGVGINWL